jgi:hypothetical protein
MIHNIIEPDTSPDFTVNDIHKIREWNYERLKDATKNERIADTRERIAPLLAELGIVRPTRNKGDYTAERETLLAGFTMEDFQRRREGKVLQEEGNT